MSENAYLRRHWKALINIVTVLALAVLVVLSWHDIDATIKNFAHVHAWALLLLIPIEAWNYDAQARMYRRLFEMVGNGLNYKSLYAVSLELNFINNILPSGGVSGISYFSVRMRSEEKKITGSKATVVQSIKLMMIFLSFELLLVLGVIFMAIVGGVNDLTILVASSISTLMVVGTIVFLFIVASSRRINAALSFLTRAANQLIRLVRRGSPETFKMNRVRQTVDELHSNYQMITKDYRQLKWPFIFALIANMTEVLAVYVVYIAFGHWVNIGAVIVAYAVANFAGLVSVLPGGIGIYEALMTGILAAAGVPASLSIPVVVMYRILNTVIQMPPGYYFYNRTLHARPKELKSA